MAKPPPSGPHSDLKGVDQDARAGFPSRDERAGTAADKHEADANSAATPERKPPLGD